MGLFLGYVAKYNKEKGLISIAINEPISIGDTISLENETGTYKISELMIKNENIKNADINAFVTIGRMKGKIKVGDKIFKMSSKKLINEAILSYSDNNESRKIPLDCNIVLKKEKYISINITSASNLEIYKNLNIKYELNEFPTQAINHPLSKEKVISQISKTSNTPYYFKNINIDMDENIFIPNIKLLNELRRNSLKLVENFALEKISRKKDIELKTNNYKYNNCEKTISVLLNYLSLDYNYENLKGFDNVYIPLKYFTQKEFSKTILTLSKKFNIYVYLPTIIKSNYRNLLATNIETAINKYSIKGFVLSNISNFNLLQNYNYKDFEFISNYTFNIFNYYTIEELSKLGIKKFTISPELDKETITNLIDNSNQELIVYGRAPLMNMNYCPIGQSNRCYPTCKMKCNTNNTYSLRDRLNIDFPLVPDNIQTVSTLYNSKTTSISKSEFPDCSLRIDILNENIDEINNIVETVKLGKFFQGKEYTRANLNQQV